MTSTGGSPGYVLPIIDANYRMCKQLQLATGALWDNCDTFITNSEFIMKLTLVERNLLVIRDQMESYLIHTTPYHYCEELCEVTTSCVIPIIRAITMFVHLFEERNWKQMRNYLHEHIFITLEVVNQFVSMYHLLPLIELGQFEITKRKMDEYISFSNISF